MLATAPDLLSRPDRAIVAAVSAAVPVLLKARDLVDRFHHMIRCKDARALDPWLEAATRSPLGSFAKGIMADKAAVAAAIVEPCSNGQTCVDAPVGARCFFSLSV
jgi:transposase